MRIHTNTHTHITDTGGSTLGVDARGHRMGELVRQVTFHLTLTLTLTLTLSLTLTLTPNPLHHPSPSPSP